jgi:hypothetical protein
MCMTPQEYYPRFRKFVEDENELGKIALAQCIIHRRVILDLLAKALKQDPETGKYALEKTVHSGPSLSAMKPNRSNRSS